MARVLLLGKNGQVGSELQRLLKTDHRLTAVGHAQLDLASTTELKQAIQSVNPEIIINAAAYTDVDRAESEPSLAYDINAEALRVLGHGAARRQALLIHYSTDYVFDGTKGSPYTEQDQPNPINVYGQSKLAGEQYVRESGCHHFILRTSWVYSLSHPSFVSKVLEWARTRQELQIVRDQIGSPTWSSTLAHATLRLVGLWQTEDQHSIAAKCGTYHVAAVGAPSRFELAKSAISFDIKADEHTYQTIEPVTGDQFPLPADRPRNTSLDSGKFQYTFDHQLPNWEVALEQALLNSPID